MQHIDQDNYPLSLEEFREWLESKDVNDVVGKTRDIYHCPISLVLQEKVQNNKSYVGIVSTYIPVSEIDTLDYDNPQWVTSFISHLDRKFKTTNVTAKQALEVLEEIL